MQVRIVNVSVYRSIIDQLTDTTMLEAEAAKLKAECDVVVGLLHKIKKENARTPLEQTD